MRAKDFIVEGDVVQFPSKPKDQKMDDVVVSVKDALRSQEEYERYYENVVHDLDKKFRRQGKEFDSPTLRAEYNPDTYDILVSLMLSYPILMPNKGTIADYEGGGPNYERKPHNLYAFETVNKNVDTLIAYFQERKSAYLQVKQAIQDEDSIPARQYVAPRIDYRLSQVSDYLRTLEDIREALNS